MRPIKPHLLSVCVGALLVASCAAPPQRAIEPSPDDLKTAVAGTLTALSPSATSTEPAATASPTATPRVLWMCYSCGGDTIWELGPDALRPITLPAAVGTYYGYSLQTGRILMAARFGDHGAGPGNAAVSDLSVLDPETGEVSQILPDNVVEAAWGPDGRAVAYILATPSTYELHWRTAGGEDHLLAEDVTFTWSVAPSGEAIAFTRETGYELGVPPGLFVVTVPDGHEIQLSDADKGGVGSTGDRPAWSPDSQEVIFSLWGGEEDRLILARADGSQVFDIGLDPTASDAWWGGKPIPDLLWFPDREHLVVNSASTNAEHGPLWDGPTALVVYRIDRNQQRLADGRLVGEAMGLIGWNVPGESVWAFGPDGHPQSLNVLISR